VFNHIVILEISEFFDAENNSEVFPSTANDCRIAECRYKD